MFHIRGECQGISRSRGLPPAARGHIAAIAAAEPISHFGARPERPLAELVAAAGIA